MRTTTKMGTVALIVQRDGQDLLLVENIADDREIEIFESALQKGENTPLESIYQSRLRQEKEDEDFGNYVEDLLSQPFVRPEIQEHGVQWLKSKIRIEQFQKSEREAAKIIADYAFKLYQENPSRTDFFLAGPAAKVRIRIFVIDQRRDAPNPGEVA